MVIRPRDASQSLMTSASRGKPNKRLSFLIPPIFGLSKEGTCFDGRGSGSGKKIRGFKVLEESEKEK